jgi:hypothetical protein
VGCSAVLEVQLIFQICPIHLSLCGAGESQSLKVIVQPIVDNEVTTSASVPGAFNLFHFVLSEKKKEVQGKENVTLNSCDEHTSQ